MNDANVTSLTANYSDDARKNSMAQTILHFLLLPRIVFPINGLTC